MQKSIVSLNYTFHENYVYITSCVYNDLKGSNMVLLIHRDYNKITDYTYLKTYKKISFNTILKIIKKKSLIIISGSILDNYEHHRRIIETNKNVYFGYVSYCIENDSTHDVKKYIPNDVSKFVLLHMDAHPTTNFDFSDSICLQNIYHCFVNIRQVELSKCCFSTKYQSVMRYDIDSKCNEYGKFTFKLPYGCVIKIINDFNKLVN